jgi:hypothetical protein
MTSAHFIYLSLTSLERLVEVCNEKNVVLNMNNPKIVARWINTVLDNRSEKDPNKPCRDFLDKEEDD